MWERDMREGTGAEGYEGDMWERGMWEVTDVVLMDKDKIRERKDDKEGESRSVHFVEKGVGM